MDNKKAIQQWPPAKEHPQRAVAASSSQSLFSGGNSVAAQRLPKALLVLNQQIKELTDNYLIVTGGAVESLFLKETEIKDYDGLVRNISLEKLERELIKRGYDDARIVGKHKVLRFHVNELEIELCVLKNNSAGYQPLREDASLRDFKSSAMYLLLSDANEFELYDPYSGLKCLKSRQIDIIDRPGLFQENPIRLFRLVKAMLKRPDFKLTQQLVKHLKTIDFNTLWKDYFAEGENAKLHRGRAQTAFLHLLERFSARDVMAALAKIGSLSGLTGIEQNQLSLFNHLYENLTHLDYDRLYKFSMVAVVLFFNGHQQDSKLQVCEWPFLPVVFLNSEQQNNLLDIRNYYLDKTPIPEGVSIDAREVIEVFDKFSSTLISSKGATGFK